MTVHLIKLSVGPTALSDLAAWQTQRLEEKIRNGQKSELMHITRHTPKRAAELLDGGSIYWIIKGWLCARQKLLELRPHRPFQGWRYFAEKDIPADLEKGKVDYDMPEEMLRELTFLGII